MIKKVSFWGNRLQELDFGHILFSKFVFVITVVNFTILISLKWDFDPTNYIVPIGLATALVLWYVGRIGEKKGLRKYFRQAQFKDVKLK